MRQTPTFSMRSERTCKLNYRTATYMSGALRAVLCKSVSSGLITRLCTSASDLSTVRCLFRETAAMSRRTRRL